MSRSIKKGPVVDERLLKKIKQAKESGSRTVIKTYSRHAHVTPEMVGATLGVHNGRNFIPVLVSEQMVGHKLGEFSLTRTFRTHGRVVERSSSPT